MRPGNRLAREAVLSAAAAAAAASLLAWLGPPGSDLAAHAYQRAVFLQHGFSLWNNFWYAGRYSFVTYSLIYYPLAALLGIRLLAVATVAMAALAFAVVLGREWGPTARWSSRTFAVVWAGIVLSAAFPFALGAALALLTIWALQAGARWRFAALALLTLAASPVAFLLLALVLGGIGLARERSRQPRPGADGRGRRGARARALAALPGRRAVPVLARRVPGRGDVLPDRRRRSRGTSTARSGGSRSCTSRPARPSSSCRPAVGENIARLRYAAIPFCVLVLSLRRWRPLAGVPGRVRARGLVERLAARRQLRARRVRPDRLADVLGARGRLPAAAADAFVPRRGGGHGRPLGRGLPAAGRDPGRARLVPAGRLPARTAALPASWALRRTSPGCGRSASATSSSPTRRRTTARGARRRCCEAGAPGSRRSSGRCTRRVFAVPHAAADRDRARPGARRPLHADAPRRRDRARPAATGSPSAGRRTGT